MRPYPDIDQLVADLPLTREKSYNLFSQMATYPLSQQALILNTLSQKEETVEMLLGAMDALLEHTIFIHYPHEVIDIVGTGGDGLKTFNISTAASLVVASCGVTVAKHGGRRVTSLSGSTDVLAALGIPMPHTADASIALLNKQNYAYLSAPLFNPLLNAFAEVRKQLGVPTLFNTLGPLINPIRPKRQVLGVYRQHLVPTIAQVLKTTGVKHALVVHSKDGLDELSISGPTYIAEVRDGLIREYQITPEAVGLKSAPLQDVIGGNSTENANLIRDLFLGKIQDAKLNIVLLNSAAGLLVGNKVTTLQEGVEMARSAIATGMAANFLHHIQAQSMRGQL